MNTMIPFLNLRNEMNRLLEEFFEDMPTLRPYSASYPPVNLWQDEIAAHLEAELPGVAMEDIEILVRGNELTLRGRRRIEEPKDACWHRRERSEGQFSRTLTLPWEIDANGVEAKLHAGVLMVKLPKSESCKARKIKVLPA